MFVEMIPWICLDCFEVQRGSVERCGAGKVSFGGARPGGPFDRPGRVSSVRVKEHGQPRNGTFIVFAFPAHITYPGREVGDRDQFIPKPGKVGDVPDVHDSRVAFIAWIRTRRRGECSQMIHLTLHQLDAALKGKKISLICLMTCHSFGGQ